MKSIEQINQHFVNLFEENHQLDGCLEDTLDNLKTSALNDFKVLGIPNIRDENYKYLDVSSFFQHNFISLNENDFIDEKILHKDAPNSIFLQNGSYVNNTVDSQEIIIINFKKAVKKYPNIFNQFINRNPEIKDGLITLNYMFAESGLFLYIPKNYNDSKTISIIDNITVENNNILLNNRFVIFIEKGAKVNLKLENKYKNSAQIFHNRVIEVFLNENSHLALYTIQSNPNDVMEINSMLVTQKKHSHFFNHITSLSGKVIRNNLHIYHQDTNCETSLYGFYFSDISFQIDNFIVINHKKPQCQSTQHFKGIVDYKGIASFCGKILVYKDAQKTLAYQQNNNFLLSKQATINSKPQLIIEADDVKCSHGATVGQIDKNQLFYLQARGINKKLAETMLIYAFINEIIDKIDIENIKSQVKLLVKNKLKITTE